VRANIAAKLVGLRAAADALRAKHSAEDDERTAAADAAARKLAAKEEAVRVRSERRDSRRRCVSTLFTCSFVAGGAFL